MKQKEDIRKLYDRLCAFPEDVHKDKDAFYIYSHLDEAIAEVYSIDKEEFMTVFSLERCLALPDWAIDAVVDHYKKHGLMKKMLQDYQQYIRDHHIGRANHIDINDLEKSLRDAYACGEDGLRWACELYYEYYNSSVGMKHRIMPKDGILLNEDGTDSDLIISGAENIWQCQHYDEAMSIYEAMESFGVELWFTALLRTWLENGETNDSLLKKLSRQYYYEDIKRAIERV